MADGAAAAGAADRSLDPKVLDRLSGLELVARTIVEGFLADAFRPIAASEARRALRDRLTVHLDCARIT